MSPEAAATVRRGELIIHENIRQLRASYEYGTAATLMPVKDGWKLRYFSSPDFEEEPGTTFATYEAAVVALNSILPVINSDEEKDKARDMEELPWLRLQAKIQSEDIQQGPA